MNVSNRVARAAPPRRILWLASVAAVAGGAVPAAAQTAALEKGAAIEEVVVTAQRREERLQDVPAAVTAFQGQQLERLGISGSKQLTQVTPGLNFTQSVYSPQPTIRGIGTRGVGTGDESVVPIYIDGVYQPFIPATDLQFNNIERIEVLKGPQGALMGRNATGGAINIITKTPDAQPHVAASARYGRFNEWVGKGYLSGGTDVIAADLAVVASRDDGYIKDPLRNDTYGGRRDVSLRSKVVVHPAPKLDLTAAGAYTNNVDSTGVAYNSFNGDTVGRRIPGNPVTTQDFRSRLSYHPYFKVNQYNLSLTGVYHFENFDLTALTSYQNNNMKNRTDSDSTPVDLNTTIIRQFSKNEYNELYAVSNGDGHFNVIAGAVYYHDVSGNNPYVQTLTRSVSATGVIGALSETRFDAEIETNSYALYLQAGYKLTEALSVTLGGRYTHEKKDFASNVGVTTITHLANSATFQKFTPSLTVQYQPNPDLNLYAKAGQAFKAGIFNGSATTVAATKPVRPETVTQYEVGLKSSASSTLRVNLSAYYTDYKNLQSTARDPVTFTSLLQNAGAAKIYGFEAEAFWRPVEHLSLRVGVAGLHGTYSDFPGAQVIYPITTIDPVATAADPNAACAMGTGALLGGNRAVFCDAGGNKIIRTPFLTANIGGDYTIPLESGEVVVSANIYHQGKSYWDVLNRVAEPAHTLVNGRIGWTSTDGRYGFAVWGENLTDEVYRLTASISTAGDNQVIARPRTYGVEITYGF